MALPLWPHQSYAIAECRKAYREGKRSIVIVAPTGSGKTRMFCRLACGGEAKGSRVLVLAHREELIEQTVGTLQEEGVTAGVIAPWAQSSTAHVQVASVQTLLARGNYPEADIVIPDECHHHVSSEWVQILRHYQSRKALIIGATATPQRGDGVALGNVFDAMIVACQPRALIASGHLVPVRVFRPTRMTKSLAEHPIEALRTIGKGRKRTIIFAASVEHADKLAHEANAIGLRAASVDGQTPRDRRRAIIAAFRRGDLDILTNMLVLTEGFDCRETDCIILARGMTTEGTLMQACGRGMRKSPGKRDCLVLDLRGCTHELGLPDDDRRFSLEGRAIQRAAQLEPIIQCPECGYLWRASECHDAACPECGFVRRGREDPRVRRQRLAEAAAGDKREDRIDYLSKRVVECLVKRHKLGSAKIKYQLRYTPHGCSRKAWPNAGELSLSGYNAAEALLRELWLINQAHHSALALHISGIMTTVDVAKLVDLCRQALSSRDSTSEIDDQSIRVRVGGLK